MLFAVNTFCHFGQWILNSQSIFHWKFWTFLLMRKRKFAYKKSANNNWGLYFIIYFKRLLIKFFKLNGNLWTIFYIDQGFNKSIYLTNNYVFVKLKYLHQNNPKIDWFDQKNILYHTNRILYFELSVHLDESSLKELLWTINSSSWHCFYPVA